MRKFNDRWQVIRSLTIAVVASDAERFELGRLERALRVKLRSCERIGEATTLVAHAEADAVITRACDATGIPVAPVLARLRRAVPSAGVVVLVDERSPSRAMVAALRMADGVLFDKQLDRASVQAALRHAMARR
jgi:hypothetical protein